MIIIHGNKNQGKTRQIKKIVALLSEQKKTFGGFYSEKIKIANEVIGYDIVILNSNESFSFLRKKGNENQNKIGPFYIDDFALAEGINQIKKAILNKVNYLIIDEIGKLELQNRGWYVALEKAITTFEGEIILAIRTEFVEKVIKKWNLTAVNLVSINDNLQLKNI